MPALAYPCDVLLSAHFLIAGYSLNSNGFIVLALLWLTSPKFKKKSALAILLAYPRIIMISWAAHKHTHTYKCENWLTGLCEVYTVLFDNHLCNVAVRNSIKASTFDYV